MLKKRRKTIILWLFLKRHSGILASISFYFEWIIKLTRESGWMPLITCSFSPHSLKSNVFFWKCVDIIFYCSRRQKFILFSYFFIRWKFTLFCCFFIIACKNGCQIKTQIACFYFIIVFFLLVKTLFLSWTSNQCRFFHNESILHFLSKEYISPFWQPNAL